MKKKQITKLFAVMAIAASPAAASAAPSPDPWGPAANVSHLTAPEAMAAVLEIGFAAFERARETASRSPVVAPAAARPRTIPSGAPACGNVASRAPRPAECVPRAAAPILAGSPQQPSNAAATAQLASLPTASPAGRAR